MIDFWTPLFYKYWPNFYQLGFSPFQNLVIFKQKINISLYTQYWYSTTKVMPTQQVTGVYWNYRDSSKRCDGCAIVFFCPGRTGTKFWIISDWLNALFHLKRSFFFFSLSFLKWNWDRNGCLKDQPYITSAKNWMGGSRKLPVILTFSTAFTLI